jgi:tripartite-type tricarboxylate transporter receptor subunit TctC
MRIIVPYAAGGSTDVLARTMGMRLAARIGKNVVVENRPGGGTVVGTLATVKSEPDGNTILLTSDLTFAINPHTIKDLAYDPLKDLTPVIILGTTPNWVVVKSNRSEKTLNDLIETMRRNPGMVSFSVNGPGGTVHLVLENWKKASGLDFMVVPYSGVAPALVDLLGERLSATFDLVGGTIEHTKDGRLRALAVFQDTRASAVPDVPSYTESGLSNLTMLTNFVFFAPAGTPTAMVERLNRELAAIARETEMAARLKTMSIDPLLLAPADSAEYVRKTYERFKAIVRATNFRPN